MKLIKKFLNAGVNNSMSLSEISRLNIINGSIILASLNIMLYNISYLFFAPEIALEISGISTLCALFIISSWFLVKIGQQTLATHILMLSSMYSVFRLAYYYFGPEFGFQKYFMTFALITFIYFPRSKWIISLFYAISNFVVYLYLEHSNYPYLFTPEYKSYSHQIASSFNAINLLIGFSTLILVMYIFEYIISKDEAALVKALESANHNASHDHLTGAINRRSLSDHLNKLFANPNHHHNPHAIIMWDIDDFKKINDTYGHSVGDDVLIGICNLFNKTLKQQGLLARWGGEEFVIYLENCPRDQANKIAEHLRVSVERLDIISDHTITISIGVTLKRSDDSFASLFKRVDELMYKAKANGKNQVISG
ncbi:MAG: GGDEF domain-containing protein [Tissierellales bacterium]|jgi:diguanylate cyclase (GGDEF)-like protein|nr:GGDEF domain-containing protein [Tissierellales bacterium]